MIILLLHLSIAGIVTILITGRFSILAHLKAQKAVRVRLGAQISDKTSQNSLDIEEFLAGLRFEKRGKLGELTIRL
jgi:hypothetical protein